MHSCVFFSAFTLSCNYRARQKICQLWPVTCSPLVDYKETIIEIRNYTSVQVTELGPTLSLLGPVVECSGSCRRDNVRVHELALQLEASY